MAPHFQQEEEAAVAAATKETSASRRSHHHHGESRRAPDQSRTHAASQQVTTWSDVERVKFNTGTAAEQAAAEQAAAEQAAEMNILGNIPPTMAIAIKNHAPAGAVSPTYVTHNTDNIAENSYAAYRVED